MLIRQVVHIDRRAFGFSMTSPAKGATNANHHHKYIFHRKALNETGAKGARARRRQAGKALKIFTITSIGGPLPTGRFHR